MIYLIGDANFSLRPDWKEFVKAPEAPSNYKDPEKIREYLDKKMQSVEADILSTTVSLFVVQCPVFAVSASVEGDTLEQKICNLLWEDEITYFGNRAVLYALFADATPSDSVYMKDVRKALFTRSINFQTLEDMRFTSGDRKMLLTEKLMPPRDVGESYLKYCVRVLNLWGITEESNWSFI